MPVYNGLTDEWYPTQILADFLTFREHVAKPLNEVVFYYPGRPVQHGRLLPDSGPRLGMDVRIPAPVRCGPATRPSTGAIGGARDRGQDHRD